MNGADSQSSALEVTSTVGIWFARLNRPARRNALSEDLVAKLLELCSAIEREKLPRALVLWGSGGHFCAGADTSRVLDMLQHPPARDGDPITRHNRAFGALLERLHALPVPTVAVVRGSAIGGGCGIAAACDRVLAADDAVFSMPEVTLGIVPAQIAPFIVMRAGRSAARWLLTCGEPISAERAREIGLADVVVPPAELQAAASAALQRLLKTEPHAVKATRQLLDVLHKQGLSVALDEGSAAFARLLRTGAASQGLAAMRERRPPEWAIDVPEMPEFR